MLERTIRAAVGPDITVVDSAATTAASVRTQLESAGLLDGAPGTARLEGAAAVSSARGWGTVRFLATDNPDRFARIGGLFLDRPIAADQVELIDL
jgi:glutamate racemase